MKAKGPGHNEPNDDKERQRNRKQWQSALVASQFAYTLVIATLLMGWLGHWLGSLLGGGLWSTILMFLLGSAGFVAEMWRMYKFFAPSKDNNGDDEDGRPGPSGQSGDTPPGTKRTDEIERSGDENDRRDNDDIGRPGADTDRLSQEELDEIIREIEGLTKEEREELARELGKDNKKGSND